MTKQSIEDILKSEGLSIRQKLPPLSHPVLPKNKSMVIHTVQVLDHTGNVLMRKALDQPTQVRVGDELTVTMVVEPHIEPLNKGGNVGICAGCNQPIVEYLCEDCRGNDEYEKIPYSYR